MINNIFNRLILCLALMIFSCSKDKTLLPELTQGTSESAVGKIDNASANDRGAIQVYGVGFLRSQANVNHCWKALSTPFK